MASRLLLGLGGALATSLFIISSAPGGTQPNPCLQTIETIPCPDLAFASDPTFDSPNSISFVVTNNGDRASGPSTAEATGDRISGSEPVPMLDPETSEPVSIEVAIPDDLRGQTVMVAVRLDSLGEVDELDEANNESSVEFEVPLENTTTTTETTTTSTTTTTVTTATGSTTTDGSGPPPSDHRLVVLAIAGGIVLVAALLIGAYALIQRRATLPRQAPPEPAESHAGGEGPSVEPDIEGAEAPAKGEIWPSPSSDAAPAAAAAAPAAPEMPGAERAPRGPRARYVSTGFAPSAAPDAPLRSTTPLHPGATYFFWLEVGTPVAGTIEETPIELAEMERLPADSRLTVVLFPLVEGSDDSGEVSEGELTLSSDGRVVVSRQPSPEVNLPQDGLLGRRLFFAVEAPPRECVLQFRCSIYHKQVLLQSRLVSASVSMSVETLPGALHSRLDFTLAPSLDPRHVARLPEYRLSLLLNQTEEGTHSLTVKGERFSDGASFDPLELATLVERARKSLRKAAWGSEQPWQLGDLYRYNEPTNQKLREDLVSLARWGIRFYVAISDRLAEAKSQEGLETSMVAPGYVQLAVKQSPRHLLPAAILYDYVGLKDTGDEDEYLLCPEFLSALEDETPLEQAGCFQGQCPSRGMATTVCPSGFWGFRHALGIPVTLKGAADVPTAIAYRSAPSISVAVCTDPSFTLRAAHEQVLRELSPDLRYAATLTDALKLLQEPTTELVYFYCHGGIEKDVPYIKVGPLSEEPITAVTLFNQRIRWETPRPLVFLNGCHTTGLEPEQALEFVSALIRHSQAAGVVGTEITVFEPLARAFAEDCLRRLLAGVPLGWAIRDARLALLKEKNPLGLIYLPYALPSLQLVAAIN
jgi:CARDB/CHAT domain